MTIMDGLFFLRCERRIGQGTPIQTAIVCAFADALREIRKNEIELLRLRTVDHIRSMYDAMRELRAERNADRRG